MAGGVGVLRRCGSLMELTGEALGTRSLPFSEFMFRGS